MPSHAEELALLRSVEAAIRDATLAAAALDGEASALASALAHEIDVVRPGVATGAACMRELQARAQGEFPALAAAWGSCHITEHGTTTTTTTTVDAAAADGLGVIRVLAASLLQMFDAAGATGGRALQRHVERFEQYCATPARRVSRKCGSLEHSFPSAACVAAAAADGGGDDSGGRAGGCVAASSVGGGGTSRAVRAAVAALHAAWDEAAAIEESEEGAASLQLISALTATTTAS